MCSLLYIMFFFFFQAEDGIRDRTVTGVQTCALPISVLQEEVNVNKNLYDSILRRLNETTISNDIAVSNMQITQSAERPRFPNSPNIPIDLTMYAAIGLFIGAGLAFFLEYVNSRLETPSTSGVLW